MARKTLFNTTEESNFILNMTEEKYSELASKALFLTCILGTLFTVPYELSDNVGFSIVSGGLAVCGVICMIFALIAVMKKYITKKMLVPVGAFGALTLWSLFSSINAFEFGTAFYGTDGRGEGLLTTIFYFCIFITAMTIKGKKRINLLSDSLVAVGFINSFWALLQLLIDSFKNNYRAVPLSTLSKDENGIIAPSKDTIHAVSGLAHSPIFLAALLTIALTVSLIGVLINENKTRRIFYSVSAILTTFISVFTYSLLGWVGFGAAIIIAVVTAFVKKAPKKRLVSVGLAAAAPVLSIVLITAGAFGIYSKYSLHDGPLMWRDSWFRLDCSGSYNTPDVREDMTVLDDTKYVYGYMNGHTAKIVKRYPLLGTGPENLIYAMVYENIYMPDGEIVITGESGVSNEGTFDKCYNEYLYIAATRGIPSLIALLAVIISVMAAAVGKLKKKSSDNTYIALCVTASTAVIFLVGTSSIAFAPIFWAFAGMCVGNDE